MKLLIPVKVGYSGFTARAIDGVCLTGDYSRPYLNTALLNDMLQSRVVSADLSSVNSDTSINNWLFTQGISPFPPNKVPDDHAVYTDGALPKLSYVEIDVTRKAPGTAKEFKAAKARGEIVLKPLLRFTGRIDDRYYPVFNGNPVGSYNTYVTDFSLTTVTEGPFWHPDPRACNWSGTYVNISVEGMDGTMTVSQNSSLSKWPACHVQYLLYRDSHMSSVFAELGTPSLGIIPTLFDKTVPPGLINPALDEIHSGVYDLLTEIGEARETVTYLYSILRRIVQIAVQVRSKEAAARKKFKGKELIDEIASLWMQFRYAVSPLAYSAADIQEYLTTLGLRQYLTARKRRDIDYVVEDQGWTYRFTVEHRVFVKGRFDLSSTYNGLGLNPIKTLWELTPLAFVVNWVFPVASMLGALVPPSDLIQVAASHSMRIRSGTVEKDGVVLPITIDYYNNEVIPATAEFNLRPEVFLNWKRSLDAAALSWGIFIKRLWK